MKRIINEIFKRKKLVIMLFIIMLGYGIYAYLVIPKQEMPEIDTPYMVMSITVPSMSATDIEGSIVDDVEKLILTYQDVTDVRSQIYDNYAVIITTYSFSTDSPDALSKDIFNKVNELSLSDNITDIAYSSSFDDPHIIFAVNSESLSEIELEQYAESFKNELLLIDQINTVDIDNVFQKEVVITLDTDLLNAYGLSITQVYQIIYANSLSIPLGGIDTIYGTISIDGAVSYDELSDLNSLIIIPEIPFVSPQVLLGDLSTIELIDTSNKTYEFNGNKTLFISVYFNKDIDFTKMGDEVLSVKDNFLNQENDDALFIDEMLFLPDYVNAQINNVFYSLLIAIAVVMVIVLLGIGWRNSLLIIATIPVIIFSTVGILYLFGFELHKLTIVGLIVAIGIMVDNQIVITEGIKRNLDFGIEKIEAAKKAIRDNLGPVLSSTATTIAAFIVIVLLPGFLGEIVGSMPLTVIIAITLSFIVSMTLSPVIATIFLKPSKKANKTSIHETRIKKMIANTIKFPLLWLFVGLITLVGSVYLAFSTQSIDPYPNDERAVLYIDFESEIIGDIAQTELIRDQIVDEFIDNEDLISYASSIGGNLPNFHFSAKLINELPHIGRIYLTLDLNETELLNYKEELEDTLEITGAKITINTLELSPPIAPVRVFLQSGNKESIEQLNANLLSDISDLDYIKSYASQSNIKSVKYYIDYDFTEIANAFLTKAQIDTLIAINLNGLDLNIYEYNSEIINVNLNSDIVDYTDIYSILIFSETTDTYYPLSTFITISEEIDYVSINRLNNKPVAIIDLYPDDIDNMTLEKNIKDIVAQYDTDNIIVTYGGENEMFTEISGDLITASIIALILIFIIMFIQFNNFIKPLIVYLTIPLSFTGSFLFLVIFNSPITATSLVGMVSLLGVTVNTGILLVEYISRNHHNGDDVKKACVDAVYLRFRPIILTSTTTILGLIPLLITGGNFFRPLAITFMGGLVTSTLITIFLVPSVYTMIYHKKNKKVRD